MKIFEEWYLDKHGVNPPLVIDQGVMKFAPETMSEQLLYMSEKHEEETKQLRLDLSEVTAMAREFASDNVKFMKHGIALMGKHYQKEEFDQLRGVMQRSLSRVEKLIIVKDEALRDVGFILADIKARTNDSTLHTIASSGESLVEDAIAITLEVEE